MYMYVCVYIYIYIYIFWQALVWSFGCTTDGDGRAMLNTVSA